MGAAGWLRKKVIGIAFAVWTGVAGLGAVGLYRSRYGLFDPPITGTLLKLLYAAMVAYAIWTSARLFGTACRMLRARRRLLRGELHHSH